MFNLKTPEELRNERNLNRKEVAKAVGLSVCGYTNIELGHRNPSLNVAKRIAHCFGVPVETIRFGKEIRKNSFFPGRKDGQATGTEGLS